MGVCVTDIYVYKNLADPEPVVDVGLRAFDRGRAVVVPGLRNRFLALVSKLSPAAITIRVSTRMLRPAVAS